MVQTEQHRAAPYFGKCFRVCRFEFALFYNNHFPDSFFIQKSGSPVVYSD
jgi:hypothetical protein